MKRPDRAAFLEFMASIGMEWECGEPTTRGDCFEIPAMRVDFDDDGKFISLRIYEDEE